MRLLKNTWKNKTLLLMCLPALILFIMFSYIPMFGLVLAFKDYKFSEGILGSSWVGMKNFRLLWVNVDNTLRLLRNTVGYYLLFTAVNLVGKIAIAIGINEFVRKKTGRLFQTCMILPTFITYVAVSIIAYAFLAPDGIVNGVLESFSITPINFYMDPKPWPVVLTVVQAWKGWGYGSVLYLSVLAGIDQEMYEAAVLDGANAWQKIRYITIPMLVPMATVMTLMGLGGIMHSDTGLFYQVTKNIGAIRSTTQVLDSYVMNAIMTGSNYGMTSAFTLFQSVVGCLMLLGVNGIVRKIDPDSALF